jgi:hypothetical protein
MQLLSTFGETRRSRRRQASWRLLRWCALAAALAIAVGAGYRIGVSQGRTEAARLEQDLTDARELQRLAGERLARAEQQAETAIARHAQLQRRFADEVPSGELRRLLELATAQLRAGVPVARLEFLLREAAVERRCDRAVETQRLVVHTPAALSPMATAAFAEGRVMVSAEGAKAPIAAEGAEPGFDPERPVTLRFLDLDGDVATAAGRLPLAHALVQGGEEFRFAARADDRPDRIEVTSQRCRLP